MSVIDFVDSIYYYLNFNYRYLRVRVEESRFIIVIVVSNIHRAFGFPDFISVSQTLFWFQVLFSVDTLQKFQSSFNLLLMFIITIHSYSPSIKKLSITFKLFWLHINYVTSACVPMAYYFTGFIEPPTSKVMT